eukprot:COSAG02_NODE_22935_length_735_cov_1.295597_1_plen_55_part_01
MDSEESRAITLWHICATYHAHFVSRLKTEAEFVAKVTLPLGHNLATFKLPYPGTK